jgi:serine/threonine protein phosphatase PrpC
MLGQMIDNPYLIMGCFALGLIGLIRLRRLLNREFLQKTPVAIGNAQTKGRRSEQEDSFATARGPRGVMVVLADGMGGYSNGKIASEIVAKTFVGQFRDWKSGGVEQFFQATARVCNDQLLNLSRQTKSGSTLAAIIVTERKLYWLSIGDSAIMMYRDGELSNLNKKHNLQTLLEQQYQSGKITKAELINNPKRKRLTSYLGSGGFREIAFNEKPLKLSPNDKIILCSDGVYNSITELELENVLALNLKPNDTAERIIRAINAKKIHNQDNATIVILKVI